MSILIPVGIVVVIGLIAGIILTIASKVMYVPVDQLVIQVRDQLPGANCGACGFNGCDDYAAALAEDKGETISTSACPVGGSDLAQKLASVLGVEAGTAEPQVAVVMCGGNAEVAKTIMKQENIYTCKGANQLYGGQWACTSGCLGLGDCSVVCDFDAIHVVDGLALFDRNKCVGCGKCEKVCPKHIIQIRNKKNLVYVACHSNSPGAQTRKRCMVGCIGCMKCQKACKFDAIYVENNLARVDFDKCKNCGLCEKECPTGAIINLRPKKKAAPKKAEEKAEVANS